MLKFSEINILGAGLSCIDVIKIKDSDDIISLGGTSANVISILSMLGVSSYFLQADYTGINSEWFDNEFEKRKINVIKFNRNSKEVPCIIETLDSGAHKFITTCPICKKKINEIKLPNSQQVKNLLREKSFNLFYYDRISDGIKCIAKKNQNGWNMYEPNSIRAYDTFIKNTCDADIIKLSQGNISKNYIERMRKDLDSSKIQILIVSLGEKGLKYAYRKDEHLSEWVYLESNNITSFVDSTGAGDWLTASFLYYFLQRYPVYETEIKTSIISNSLIKAQEAAAYSCTYVGAQTIFEKKEGVENINKILNSKIPVLTHSNLKKGGCRFCKK